LHFRGQVEKNAFFESDEYDEEASDEGGEGVEGSGSGTREDRNKPAEVILLCEICNDGSDKVSRPSALCVEVFGIAHCLWWLVGVLNGCEGCQSGHKPLHQNLFLPSVSLLFRDRYSIVQRHLIRWGCRNTLGNKS
jgi:hypothetical protein